MRLAGRLMFVKPGVHRPPAGLMVFLKFIGLSLPDEINNVVGRCCCGALLETGSCNPVATRVAT